MALLLLSGGIASACVAFWRRPERCLFIDYGQEPAAPARAASLAVAKTLGLAWDEVQVDCSALEVDEPPDLRETQPFGGAIEIDPWPYRHQLMVTLAAAWAQPHGERLLLLAARADDATRPEASHLLYRRLDQLLRMQPGGLRLSLPGLHLILAELVDVSGASPTFLAQTYSCEVASVPCGVCSGCRDRAELFGSEAGGGIAVPARQR